MYCKKCGQVAEGAFCGGCGTAVSVEAKLLSPIQTEQLPHKELQVVKRKHMGNATYKTITTTLVAEPSKILIEKRTKPAFMKELVDRYEIPGTDILSVTSRTHIDIWNIIFGVIFGILGIFNWFGFVMAALVFFVGYGKVVAIALRGGKVIEIPVELANAGEQVIALVQNAASVV